MERAARLGSHIVTRQPQSLARCAFGSIFPRKILDAMQLTRRFLFLCVAPRSHVEAAAPDRWLTNRLSTAIKRNALPEIYLGRAIDRRAGTGWQRRTSRSARRQYAVHSPRRITSCIKRNTRPLKPRAPGTKSADNDATGRACTLHHCHGEQP